MIITVRPLYSESYRVDNVWRGHLGDHGHDIDQSDPLASQAGRHDLHCVLEANIHGVGSEESSKQKDDDLKYSEL